MNHGRVTNMTTKDDGEEENLGEEQDMPLVSEVIAIAAEWVETHGQRIEGFAGAYLFGGITSLPRDAPFPSFRDVDLIIVLKSGPKSDEDNLELPFKGIVLEVGFRGLEEHRDPATVLSDPELAPNLAHTTVLADPLGILESLQTEVSEGYRRRRWVMARCEVEKHQVRVALEAMSHASDPLMRLIHLWFVVRNLSGLLAIAEAKTPTNRRALALMRDLVRDQGRMDLHLEMLELCRISDLSRGTVETLLLNVSAAFDRAVEVKKTPATHDWKLETYLRPYVVEGSQEMIDEGLHRESVFWIALPHATAQLVLRNDAPEAEKSRFEQTFRHLLDQLDLIDPRDWPQRVSQAHTLATKIFDLADELAANHPE